MEAPTQFELDSSGAVPAQFENASLESDAIETQLKASARAAGMEGAVELSLDVAGRWCDEAQLGCQRPLRCVRVHHDGLHPREPAEEARHEGTDDAETDHQTTLTEGDARIPDGGHRGFKVA